MLEPGLVASEKLNTTAMSRRLEIGGLRQFVPGFALVAWTFFVWGGRVRNIVTDDGGVEEAGLWRLVLIASFLLLALVTSVCFAWLFFASIERLEKARSWYGRSSLVLAGFGIAVWLVRGIDITFGDHSVAFKAVHAVLALVTIGLGLWVIRAEMGRTRLNA